MPTEQIAFSTAGSFLSPVPGLGMDVYIYILLLYSLLYILDR